MKTQDKSSTTRLAAGNKALKRSKVYERPQLNRIGSLQQLIRGPMSASQPDRGGLAGTVLYD